MTMTMRALLRDATREAHARVDGLFVDGLSDACTYRGYLAGMHALVAEAREALPDAATLAAVLADDLQALGVAPGRTAARSIPDGERLGWRYVVDGSSLGARVLLRDARRLGFDERRGARFLAHHAAGAGWAATREALEACPADAAARRTLCAAAGRAFAAAHAALGRALADARSALPA